MKFEEYCDHVEKLMILPEKEIYKICFEILDQDNDKRISVSDVFSFMYFIKETDVMNMNDLENIIKDINNHKNHTENIKL